MIRINSISILKKDQKKLLENIADAFSENKIMLDRAAITGREVLISCGDPKKAIKILKKINGIQKFTYNKKEYLGVGGLPKGARAKVFVERGKDIKLAERAGFEIVKKDYQIVVSKNIKKWKKKGFLALDFSYWSTL